MKAGKTPEKSSSNSSHSNRSVSPPPKNIDYSKWNDIEISDDEDETKKNIDKGSLFRFRHQSRLERMVERKEKEEDLEKLKREVSFDEETLEELIDKAKGVDTEEIVKLRGKIEKMEGEITEKKAELKKLREPLNIDTICKDGFSSTRITKTVDTPPKKVAGTIASSGTFAKTTGKLSESSEKKTTAEIVPANRASVQPSSSREKSDPTVASPNPSTTTTVVQPTVITREVGKKKKRKVTTTIQPGRVDEGDIAEFVLSHQKALAQMATIKDWRDSREVFLRNREFCSEVGQHALTLQCINEHLALREETARNLAYLSLIASYIVDAGKEMGRDPRETELIQTLFTGLEKEEKEKPGKFAEDVVEFQKTFISQAKEKIMEIRTKEEKGLTPQDVLPTLPAPMQTCFKNQDMNGLRKLAETMNSAVFAYHMRRCSKAGLWIEKEEGEKKEEEKKEEEKKE